MKESINSVGIDIGTSTTQLIFSRLTMENLASQYSVPRISITEKEVLYRSEIYITPLLSETAIDTEAVREIVESEYKKGGFTPEQMQTGAVIITGETARKQNADEVLSALSKMAGDFVVATAGPELECVLSARGAGADKISDERSTAVANLDIGGGTTNIAVYQNGNLISTSCLDIGGRLIKISDGRLAYIFTKLEKLSEENGIKITIGEPTDTEALRKICKIMAKHLMQAIHKIPPTDSHKNLYTNGGAMLKNVPIDCITLSGGVADCVYNLGETDSFKYGDIGVILGQCIADEIAKNRLTLLRSAETIRATVVGAGAHSTQVSGSTIDYTDGILPIKNIPVLKIPDGEADIKISIKTQLPLFAAGEKLTPVALAITGFSHTSFLKIAELAELFVSTMSAHISGKIPLIIIVEADIAKALGNAIAMISPEGTPVICIDGIVANTGDYIDIGSPLVGGKILPVVVKTLIFNS